MTRKVSAHLARRFSQPSASGAQDILQALNAHYFPRQIWGEVSLTTEQWLATPEGQNDLQDHTTRRLQSFRNKVIPWLDWIAQSRWRAREFSKSAAVRAHRPSLSPSKAR